MLGISISINVNGIAPESHEKKTKTKGKNSQDFKNILHAYYLLILKLVNNM